MPDADYYRFEIYAKIFLSKNYRFPRDFIRHLEFYKF